MLACRDRFYRSRSQLVGDQAAYAFLTTGYDGDSTAHLVGAIHPKAMPVILHDDDYERWLTAPVEEALKLASPYPSQLMSLNA